MGCPDKYYNLALRALSHDLNVSMDKNKAKEMFQEKNDEVLENDINNIKNTIALEKFYFEVGRTYQYVLEDADKNDGTDGFNACIGGLNMFMDFVGLKE